MQINIEKTKKEIKSHGSPDFPVCVSEESITQYEGGSFLWHWHPEIELTWIMEGQMSYYVNDKQYLLSEGEGLFGNSNTLHSGYMVDHMSCRYLSVTFHPRFLYGYENSLLQTKYVGRITSGTELPSQKLAPLIPWQKEILEQIQWIYHLSKSRPKDYELEVHMALMRVWQNLYRYFSTLPEKNDPPYEHMDRLKEILSFIQEHYDQAITLDDIAQCVNICKSECCRFFKRHMNMTLFDYLLYYRIQQSLPLLKKGETVTKAAELCGFSSPCYYGKIFKRYMNCSPRQYKKSNSVCL